MAVSSNSERVNELRQLIHAQVTSEDTQARIKACLARANGGQPLDESSLLRLLEEEGVVEEVLSSLKIKGITSVTPVKAKPSHIERNEPSLVADRVRRHGIILQILSGRAFLDHLDDFSSHSPSSCPTFKLHVYFLEQRFCSASVQCACEPEFNETFVLELAGKGNAKMLSLPDTLSITDPIHIVLTRTMPDSSCELVGSCQIEWRQLLLESRGWLSSSVEVCGNPASESGVPAGVLDIRLELLPSERDTLDRDVVTAQMKMEKQQATERERLFLLYAKQWWKEYLEIRPTHSERLVKIFTQDEEGVSRVVCCYVRPLKASRVVESPREAARLVSLCDYEHHSAIGSTSARPEVWNSLYAFLSVKKGNCEEHCVLLCSLLLGFGLDAYVCIGTKNKGLAHSWVVTINLDGSAIFWESLTGQRFHHPLFDPVSQAGKPVPVPSHTYLTVGCLFNHHSFYANVQQSDSVLTSVFDLHDASLWKSMSRDAIAGVTVTSQWPSVPPLMRAQLDSSIISQELETQLKALVVQHRTDVGLSTHWDDELSYLLGPALVSYELERQFGVSAGNEEFQESVRRAVPEGQTFKGFPIQLNHRNAYRIFMACLRSPVGGEIINCRGDSVHLAVHVKITCYPEDLCAVWAMLAVKYKSIL